MDTQLSTKNEDIVQNSHEHEDSTTKIEKHNKRQHKPENEDWHLLKEAQRNCQATLSVCYS